MGKTGGTPETPADDEQKIEEGEDGGEPVNDNGTPVTETPVIETSEEDPVEEPTEEDVVDPTTDPEAPVQSEEPTDAEELEEIKSAITLNGDIELMADGDVEADEIRKITIDDFANVRQRVKIQAKVGSQGAKTVRTAAIAVKKADAVVLTLTAVGGYEVEKVENGTTEVAPSGSDYTIAKADTDTTIKITTAAVYNITLKNETATTGRTAITLDESLKEAANNVTEVTTSVKVKNAMDKALKFTLKGTAAANTKTIVSYKPNADDDDEHYTVIDPDVDETTKAVSYTVPATVLADLDGDITIKLSAEAAKTVTLSEDDDKVDVKLYDSEASGEDKFTKDFTVAGEKVLVGDSLKFKVTVKDTEKNIELTKVEKVVGDNDSVLLEKDDDGVYELAVTEADKDAASISIKITTDYKAANVKVLKFTLVNGDEGSATAAITKITTSTPSASGGGATEKTYSAEQDAENAITTFGGLQGDSANLTAGKSYKLADDGNEAVTAVEVTVSPKADKTYELVKTSDNETLTDGNRVYKFAATATDGAVAFAEVNEIKASTQSVEKTDATYFKIAPVTVADGATAHVNAVIDAKTADYSGDDWTIKATETKNVYTVKGGQRTVSFTIVAEEGWVLDDSALTNLSGDGAVGSISEPVVGKDGKSTYTVTLRTTKLAIETTGTDLGTLKEQEKKFTAAIVAPEKENGAYSTFTIPANGFTYTAPKAADAAKDPNPVDITDSTQIPYNSSLKLVLQAKDGRTFTGVTYTMDDVAGTETAEIKNVTVEGKLVNQATLEIPHVTGDIEISIAVSEFGYVLKNLTAAAETGTVEPTKDQDGRWIVSHEGSYVVGVTKDGKDVPGADLTAIVMKGETKVKQNKKIVTGGLQIDLANKGLAGADISVDLYVKGETQMVGSYLLSAAKETTYITVKPEGGKDNVIKQRVDSEATYDIETDGVVKTTVTKGDDADALIQNAEIVNGKLVVKTKAVKAADTKSGETAKTVTLTLSAADNNDVTQEVQVTVDPFFDAAKKVIVTELEKADTVINVKLEHGDVVANYADLASGALWYEVTATAADKKSDAADAPAFTTVQNKLKKTVVKVVKLTGTSQRTSIQVGLSDKLGEGVDWPYTLKARLVYVGNDTDYKDRTTAFEVSDYLEASAAYEDEDLVASGTQTPTFTAALKLKKGTTTTLYTGQDAENSGEMVIAIPEFKDKGFTANYQVLKGNIQDTAAYGSKLKFDVNAAGQIVVTDVPVSAMIGKHVIKVTAAADEKSGHEMYASTATITVNVVKGINRMTVSTPTDSIFKQDKEGRISAKAATLKPTVAFNETDYSGQQPQSFGSYDAKGKWVTAPKSKTVTWSIVDADSVKGNVIESSEVLDRLKGTTKTNGVTINPTNGTVTVGKDFVVDTARRSNNQFKIRVKVANRAFPGNPTYALSNKITITKSATDIGKLVIAKPAYNNLGEAESYTVLAVQDASSNAALKKAVDKEATEINGSEIFAVPANQAIAMKQYLAAEWRNLPLADLRNLTVATTNKKVLTVSDGNTIYVSAAGKKAGVKVTANDGSKATNTLNLNLLYTEDDKEKDLALAIYPATGQTYTNGYYRWDYSETPEVPLTGTMGETVTGEIKNTTGAGRLWVDVMTKSGSGYVRINDYVNCTLKVSGGKVVWNNNHSAEIISNSKTLKLTLTDNYTGADNKKKKKVFTYTLTNKAFDQTAKAPKVKVTGALHTNAKLEEQNASVKLNVTDAATKAVPASKLAKVEVDWSARTDKNEYTLNKIDSEINSGTKGKAQIFALDNDGNMDLTFGSGATSLPAGSYKLKVTVVNASGAVQGLPATATLKVTKNKKLTFKPTTTYTIGKLDGAAMLTGKSNVDAKNDERVTVTWKLYNANNNGYSNNFTKFFEAVYDSTTERTSLKATPLLWAALEGKDKITINSVETNVPELDAKKDLTGYVAYEAVSSAGYYDGSTVRGEAKITVKLAADTKTGSKYAPNKPDMALTANATTPINIMVGNEFVEVAYAAIDTDTKAKTAEELDVVNDGAKRGVNDKGQVMLKVKADKTLTDKKSYTASLRIVPANSYYCAEIAGGLDSAPAAQADEPTTPTTPEEPKKTKAELIQQYGVAVKVTVKGAAEPKVTTPDPILNVPFTISDAETAVKAAVTAAAIQVSNADAKDDDAKNALATKVLAEANNADLKNKYTVADKKESQNSVVTITKATKDAAGSAKVTLVITGKNGLSDTREVEITLTIAKVEVTDALKTAIETAVKGAATGDNMIATIDGTNASNWDSTVKALVIGEVEKVAGVKDIFTVEAAASNACTIVSGDSKTATVKLVLTVADDATDSAGTEVTITGLEVNDQSANQGG